MWIIYIALILFVVFIIDEYLIDKRQLLLSEKFNGPKRKPIIGNIDMFFNVSPKEYYEFIKGVMTKYGRENTNIVRYWAGNQLEILVDNCKVIEKIMTDKRFLSKSSQYSFLNAALGEGLLFSTNEKWFNRRRIITPTFHFKILEQFFEIFKKQNYILMENIRSKPNGKPFNIFPMITLSVLNSLCETSMGYEMKPQDEKYLKAVKEISHIVANKFLSPWQRIEFLYWLSGQKKKQDKCAKIMHDFTTTIINERRRLLAKNKTTALENLDDDDVGLKRKMCLLDVLLQSTINNKPLTNADIQEEVDTFTFAGHDTTTNAICFTLYFIAKHQDVQEKLNKEINDIIGDNEVTFKCLNEFKYLDIVIKETLRLYPPAPIISRRLFEEVEFDGFIAPANTNYNMCLYTLFRDPDIFKNPDEFMPERFLNDIPPFAFVPFSAGQRNCIGQKFALTNIKNNIINILRNFELVPGVEEPKVEINLTLKCDSLCVGFKQK